MLHRLAVGWMLGVEDFKSFWNWRSWTFGWLLRIVTSGLALVLVGKLLGSQTSLHYLLIGNIVISGCIGALFAVMATTWNRLDGTYPLLVIAPANLIPAVIGRSIIWMLQGIATSVAVLLIYSLLFGLTFSALQLSLTLLGIVLANLSTYGFAFFLGALVARLPSMRSVVFNSTGSLLAAFCGAAVPISFWPEALRWLINLLPSTHALLAIRAAIADVEIARIVTELGYEALIALLWAGLGAAIMHYMVNAGRADGSIQFE